MVLKQMGFLVSQIYFPSIKDLNSFTLWSLATHIAWSRARTLARSFTTCFMFSLKKKKKCSNISLISTKAFKGEFVIDFMTIFEVCNQCFQAHIFKEDRNKKATAYKIIVHVKQNCIV